MKEECGGVGIRFFVSVSEEWNADRLLSFDRLPISILLLPPLVDHSIEITRAYTDLQGDWTGPGNDNNNSISGLESRAGTNAYVPFYFSRFASVSLAHPLSRRTNCLPITSNVAVRTLCVHDVVLSTRWSTWVVSAIDYINESNTDCNVVRSLSKMMILLLLQRLERPSGRWLMFNSIPTQKWRGRFKSQFNLKGFFF